MLGARDGNGTAPRGVADIISHSAELLNTTVLARGYLDLEVERAALVDTTGKAAIGLSFKDVHSGPDADVAACERKLVTVTGLLTQFTRRGVTLPVIQARAVVEN